MAVGSGAVSIRDLQIEFLTGADRLSQFYRGGGIVPVTARNASIPTSGAISLAQFRGGSRATEGSFSYTSPGFYAFSWPQYEVLIAYTMGAGGGGGGGLTQDGQGHFFSGTNGASGGDSHFYASGLSVYATGGQGGEGGVFGNGNHGANGSGGNGDGNTYGGGGAGGAGGTPQLFSGGNGGTGGFAYRAFYRNGHYAPAPGSQTTIIVGAGGAGGANGGSGFGFAGNGANGSVYGSWN